MKTQFLHEAHNLQDKAKKPDYLDRIREEGADFDRGGVTQKSFLSFRGRSLHFDLRPFLAADKLSLLGTLDHWKFLVFGAVGTIPQLLKNPKLAASVEERHEMTRLSVLRANELFSIEKHPKKNREFQVLEVRCFLQPLEPFPNPVFKHSFAFQLVIAKEQS